MRMAVTAFGLSLAVGAAALAGPAFARTATVSQLSGTLSVKRADGTVKILAQKSEVYNGDTLNTQSDSYAQIKFSDGAQITLKPNTTMKVLDFKYVEDKPKQDSFLYSLLKGGLRAVTGIVGHRNHDAYKLETATATVGIRGTTFSADDCTTNREGDCAKLDPAVYVGVADGEIVVRNGSGELGLSAGQFGQISPNQRPLFLSTDPGLQFTPPASFIQAVMSGSVVNSGRSLECVVRR